LSVIFTVVWLKHRGLVQFTFWPLATTKPSAENSDPGLSQRGQVSSKVAAFPELRAPEMPSEGSKS
jgi:hypothetical protein